MHYCSHHMLWWLMGIFCPWISKFSAVIIILWFAHAFLHAFNYRNNIYSDHRDRWQKLWLHRIANSWSQLIPTTTDVCRSKFLWLHKGNSAKYHWCQQWITWMTKNPSFKVTASLKLNCLNKEIIIIVYYATRQATM